jgi:hypothetical protein
MGLTRRAGGSRMGVPLGRGALRPFGCAWTTCGTIGSAPVNGLRHLSPEHAPATGAALRSGAL